MKSILDKIRLEQYRFNTNEVLAKLNRTYISGNYNDVYEFNIEFKGLNGSTKKFKLKTKENTPNVFETPSRSTLDAYNKLKFTKKSDVVISMTDIKNILINLLKMQGNNATLFKSKIMYKSINDNRPYLYNLIKNNKEIVQSQYAKSKARLDEAISLLQDDIEYKKFSNEMFENEIVDLNMVKSEILDYFAIQGGRQLRNRQHKDYLKELQILSNLVNTTIPHFGMTMEEYLDVEGYINEFDIVSKFFELDLNLYIFGKYNEIYSFENFKSNVFIEAVKNLEYGENFKKILNKIMYRVYHNLDLTEYNIHHSRFDVLTVDNVFNMKYIDKHLQGYTDYIDSQLMATLLLKSSMYLLLNEIDEVLMVSDKYSNFNTGVYDFEVYYDDFNVSFITNPLQNFINHQNLLNKLSDYKKKSKLSPKELQKDATFIEINDTISKSKDILTNNRVDVVNDIFKLNNLANELNLIVGFNSFYYDNAILYGLLYNLNAVKVDISKIFITKEDILKLENIIKECIELEVKNLEELKNSIHYGFYKDVRDFSKYYTSDNEYHLLREGSALYNLNNAIIGKDYKEKFEKNSNESKTAKSRTFYYRKFLQKVLSWKPVQVITNLNTLTDNSNVEYITRTLNSKELNSLRFAHNSGYKNIVSIDVRDEMTDEFTSLKLIEGYFGLSIEEFDNFTLQRKLSTKEMEESVMYCRHDVYSTLLAFIHRFEFFISKFEMLELFKMPYVDIVKTRARIMSKSLSTFEAINYNDRLDLDYLDYIEKVCDDPNPTYNNVAYDTLRDIKNNFDMKKDRFLKDPQHNYATIEKARGMTYKLMGVDHEIKFGGLHGAIPKLLYLANMIMIDVGSYYPSMMIMYEMFTRSTPNKLTFPKLYLNRMYLKRAKNPKEKIYKIALNATFGLLKDPTSTALDAVQSNNICVNGQLALIELLCRLNGLSNVIQSNTDGLLIELPDDEKIISQIDNIIKSWERDYHFKLDKDEYTSIAQRDVNNYILFNGKHLDKIKVKGEFKKYNKGIDIDQFTNTNRYKDQLLTSYYIYKLGYNDSFGGNNDTDYSKIRYELEELAKNDISALQTVSKQGRFEYVVYTLNMNSKDLFNYIKDYYYVELSYEDLNDPDTLVDKYEHIFDSVKYDTESEMWTVKVKVQKVNRFFPTSDKRFGKIEKVKYKLDDTGKSVKSYSQVPDSSDNVRIYNKELLGDNVDTDELLTSLSIDFDFYTRLLLAKIEDFDLKFPSKASMIVDYNSNNWYEVIDSHISTVKDKKQLSASISKAKKTIKNYNNYTVDKTFKLLKRILKGMTFKTYGDKNVKNMKELDNLVKELKENLVHSDAPKLLLRKSLINLSKMGEGLLGRIEKSNNIRKYISKPEVMNIILETTNYLNSLKDFGLISATNLYYVNMFFTLSEYLKNASQVNENKVLELGVIENFNHDHITVEVEECELDYNSLDNLVKIVKVLDRDLNNSINNGTIKDDSKVYKEVKNNLIEVLNMVIDVDKPKYKTLIEDVLREYKDGILTFEKLFETKDGASNVKSFKNSHIIFNALKDDIVDKLYINKIIKRFNKDLMVTNKSIIDRNIDYNFN